MSTHFLFRGTLAEARAAADGRCDLRLFCDDSGTYPHIWCVARGRSAYADLHEAEGDLDRAKRAMELARKSFMFSHSTRRAMKRDARRMAECAVAHVLRAQLHLKAGLLT